MNYKEESSEEEDEDFNSVESSFNQSQSEDNSIEAERNKFKSRSLVAEVTDRLHKLSTKTGAEDTAEAVGDEEVVVEGHIVVHDENLKLANPPDIDENLLENENQNLPVAMAVFEDENGTDGDNALGNALKNLEKLDWNANDLPFFFNRVEVRMKIAKVEKNYTKFQVLSEILPPKVQDQVKSLLRKGEGDFPNNDAYKQLKTQILKIFGPRPEAAMERAMATV